MISSMLLGEGECGIVLGAYYAVANQPQSFADCPHARNTATLGLALLQYIYAVSIKGPPFSDSNMLFSVSVPCT